MQHKVMKQGLSVQSVRAFEKCRPPHHKQKIMGGLVMTTYFIHHVNRNGKDVILYSTFEVSTAIEFCSHNTKQSMQLGLPDRYYFIGGYLC